MNKSIGVQLLLYSFLLAGLSYVAYQSAPALGKTTLITGLAGGGLCLVWAFRAITGSPGKALPILTLIPINFVILSQTVFAWGGGTQEPGARTAAVVITILFALSMAMLTRIVYAGVHFAGQTNTGGNAIGGSDGRRARSAGPRL